MFDSGDRLRGEKPAYSVVGLGKLGACISAAIADRGHLVTGVDCNAAVVEAVNRGRAPVVEPQLAELIASNRERLRATTDCAEAIACSDVTIVVVPTPSDRRGAFSTRYARAAFADIGRALGAKDDYHLVVLASTVLPGATRHVLLPTLERESGKMCGADFGLCYSPEFIALGSVVRDYLNPDFVLIGEHDERAGRLLSRCYSQIVSNDAPCRRMSLENAELAKIALNAFVTTKIAFANTLADLCERIPGGDVDAVTEAIGTDSRIGRRYLRGGLGFGGPCFPRDNVAFAYLARKLGLRAEISEATDARNRHRVEHVLERIEPLLHAGATVAVLGLSYKPDSTVIEASQGMEIARRLQRRGVHVLGFDPLMADMPELDGEIPLAGSLEECLQRAEVIVLANPDPAFANVRAARMPDGSHPAIVDCWRLVRDDADADDRYGALGCGPLDDGAVARFARLWGVAPEPAEIML